LFLFVLARTILHVVGTFSIKDIILKNIFKALKVNFSNLSYICGLTNIRSSKIVIQIP